jgi:hypothetical protein
MDELIVGKGNLPPRGLFFGPEKIGKSTFAASAPSPVFIQTEDGLDEIGAARFPKARTLDEVYSQLNKVRNSPHSFFSLAIDSLDWLERLIWAKVMGNYNVKSIEKAAGGYGKGYVEAAEIMQSILVDHLDPIRIQRNMAILLIAHSRVEKVNDPTTSEYQRAVPDIHKGASSVVCEWVDVIGYAHIKIRIEQDKAKEDRFIAHALGANGGERVLRLVRTPAYLAGNRYGITQDVPLSWEAFVAAMVAAQEANQNQQPVPQVA